ncbi:putative carboxylic acid reductase [Nocardia brasiliensis NBRC 14402]|uniref:aldehyde dehydrogenase family protein n=1 Tax=Nocardia brasiliensis TaxID=37326 RepID=UPI0002ED03C9|nr:aldehyde dehydrogenase family protein [Nocardia brasiliensis]ASF07358.1 aldehyde dehydrogenase [Nocardia brasiliensis]GAJ86136.1 putative carboxylic acid reductase [Nocardia brasiliensis NBRC 14402]SUB47338.1 Aldehyde dehydrogenase family [Nocardia brasiliensis]
MLHLDALGPEGDYRSRKQETLRDRTGTPVATLSLAPALYVTRAMQALRRAPELPVDERIAAIARAGRAFATATVAGVRAAEYQRTVSAVAGLPITVVRKATDEIARAAADAYRIGRHARPFGAVGDWRDPSTRAGAAVWTRRGEVFAVHAAGNHPAVHLGWLEPLALGYRVAVRPSRREPFTPHRLISALRAAGFGADQVVLLPTAHEVAGEILGLADLGMVYGGADVVAAYGGDPRVLPQGPGRSKVLLTADRDWSAAVDTIVESVSGGGGVGCVNATAVLVEGDPAPVAAAVAARLAALPGLPPGDERAILPVYPVDAARRWEDHLRKRAAGTRAWLGGDGVVEDLGDGSAVLRPAVHQVDSPYAEQLGAELPFPCVWFAPWDRAAGLAPLRNTLVLTACTDDEQLITDLVREPTIGNVHLGYHPTNRLDPGLPHDGYLAQFLMRAKTIRR